MGPDEPESERDALSNELEAHGLDPDGFHEDEDSLTADAGVGDSPSSGVCVPGGEGVEARAEPASGVHPVAPSVRRRGAPARKGPVECGLLEPNASWGAPGAGGDFVLDVSVRQIGCFYAKPEQHERWGDRWRVFNRLTGIEHVTYGTLGELEENLQKQTESWARRFEGAKPFSAFSYKSPHIPKAS